MSTTATHTAMLAALHAIVNECMDYPPEPRYSHDSYLPAHMLMAAQQAIERACGNTVPVMADALSG